MSSTRRRFLQATATAAISRLPSPCATTSIVDGFDLARSHSIVRDSATPDFFEGMLLGNGDIGLCCTVRPDALGLHLGKSDSWDIRVSEGHDAQVLSFDKLLELWSRASANAKQQGKPDMIYLENEIPFLKEYMAQMVSSYSKTWPRPWPCGIVWIRWDSSRTKIMRQTLDPSCGFYTLDLLQNGKSVRLNTFVNTKTGALCVWSDDALELHSIAYYPNVDKSAELPEPRVEMNVESQASTFAAYQLFPSTAPTEAVPHPPVSDKDRSFALYAVVQGHWSDASSQNTFRQNEQSAGVHLFSSGPQRLRLDLTLVTPRDRKENVAYAKAEANRLSAIPAPQLKSESDGFWREFWSRSAVTLDDAELERWWYHNQYWLACCLRDGKIAPGLFGNWTSGKIGTAWHGDYHMNYNTQQVFWGVFSSNHADQHLPYIEVVENLLAMSKRYANEKFGLPGAYFPHSAYPVPSEVVPYPAPPWGYEICETPWVVQSLWWHYLYTGDEQILRRVYPLLKAAAQFIAAYVKKGEDGKYHVIPTVSPENWGFTVDFRLNKDCIMDLALIDFLLEAVVKASELLKFDQTERVQWQAIRANLAPYPRGRHADGDVWLDVQNAPTGWIYNIPVTLAPVFPGERVGLHSSAEDLAIARHTAKTIRLEGGNDVIYQPLIQARLGMLDLNWFKQEVRYCQLPNGIINDRVRQAGGRYKDSTNFDFMMRMGVWTENLSLPVVINECMLQSYSGIMRLFPNAQHFGTARFQKLRAVGAFLVSASWQNRRVDNVEILSERGSTAKLVNPWEGKKVDVIRTRDASPVLVRQSAATLEFDTEQGQQYRIREQS